MKAKPFILVIDDDTAICKAIQLLLKRMNMEVNEIQRPSEVMPFLEQRLPDLILLDMNFTIDTSGKQGLAMLEKIKITYPDLPVILITGWATVQLAVQGMKMGAKDFLAKPWDNKMLISAIQSVLTLKSTPLVETKTINFEHIVGEHPAFLSVLNMAKRVAKTDASVLIVGESGVGKELIAEAIHYDSLRAERPFVKVNLGGISSSLFESELFGHKKGAFTDAVADRKGRFELADSGTIFLDEIGDLALPSQVKLLRVLQERTFEPLGSSHSKKVDVRIISATNKNLEEMITNSTFREDLYYRINLIKIEVPALRERTSDIPLIADFFIQNLKFTYDREALMITDEAKAWLKVQPFLGNIRESKNLVERTVLMSSHNELMVDDFKQHYQTAASTTMNNDFEQISLEEMERKMIQKAMDFHNYNVSQAAKALGLTRSAMYRRLQKFGFSQEE
jgi:DNA-binding NtrC family response regulator